MKPVVTEAMMDAVLERIFQQPCRSASTLFLRAAFPEIDPLAVDRVTTDRQVRHVSVRGTSNLVVRFWTGSRCIALLLIENKIDAAFTPDQPARYAESRDAQRKFAVAPAVATLLVAPERYLASSKLAMVFDASLSYERLLSNITGPDRQLIEVAIERAESPYEPVASLSVMNFFDGYSLIARRAAPDLVLKPNPNSANVRPKASRTIYFDAKRSGFTSYPFLFKNGKVASLRVSHQCWDSGALNPSVKAMLDGWACHLPKVLPMLSPLLKTASVYLRPAGRSLAFAVDTPRLDNTQPAAIQEVAILDGLKKMQQLRQAWNGSAELLEQAAASVEKELANYLQS